MRLRCGRQVKSEYSNASGLHPALGVCREKRPRHEMFVDEKRSWISGSAELSKLLSISLYSAEKKWVCERAINISSLHGCFPNRLLKQGRNERSNYSPITIPSNRIQVS